jgi:DHA3 family macrolide efflux protein-like MFS transporter
VKGCDCLKISLDGNRIVMDENLGFQSEETIKAKSMKQFLILWAAQALSLLGSRLVQFALIWWITDEIGSASALALASLVGLVPQVILGPFIGTLVDRWNRKAIMLVADSSIAIATLGLAYLFYLGDVTYLHVLPLLFIRALGGSFHQPAMTASTTLMVPEKHFTRIQGLNQTLQGALNIVAAPLGALLLNLLPMQGVLSIDVSTAIIAVVTLAFIAVPQPKKAQAHQDQKSYWEDLRAGFRYMREWPGLVMLLLMAALINFVFVPTSSFLPLLVKDFFQQGVEGYATLQSAMGFGFLFGGIGLSIWGGFKRRVVTSLSGLVLLGIVNGMIGFVPAGWFVGAVISIFLVGAMIPVVNGPLLATMQASVDPDMQGRVFTLVNSLAVAMTPLGLIIAGPIADLIGVRSWYVIGGVICSLMGVLGFLIPTVLYLEDGRGKPADPEAESDGLASVPAPVFHQSEKE